MLVTEDVSKLEISIDVSWPQPENMWDMLVTKEVLKPNRSINVSGKHPKNI